MMMMVQNTLMNQPPCVILNWLIKFDFTTVYFSFWGSGSWCIWCPESQKKPQIMAAFQTAGRRRAKVTGSFPHPPPLIFSVHSQPHSCSYSSSRSCGSSASPNLSSHQSCFSSDVNHGEVVGAFEYLGILSITVVTVYIEWWKNHLQCAAVLLVKMPR